ncbi:MAG: hypothetical protein H6Q64_423 [Firmicutes bacterium]|nr:hypothetical protein [Bacillota bacterium]
MLRDIVDLYSRYEFISLESMEKASQVIIAAGFLLNDFFLKSRMCI